MLRKFLAILCGFIASLFLLLSITYGLQYRFPEEAATPFTWGEHWFLRALVSAICAAWAGFITGLIARKRGGILACITIFPSWLAWLAFFSVALLGYIPFGDYTEVHISVGNKVFSGILVFLLFPIAFYFGRFGEETASL